jgi:hypothetical protein
MRPSERRCSSARTEENTLHVFVHVPNVSDPFGFWKARDESLKKSGQDQRTRPFLTPRPKAEICNDPTVLQASEPL